MKTREKSILLNTPHNHHPRNFFPSVFQNTEVKPCSLLSLCGMHVVLSADVPALMNLLSCKNKNKQNKKEKARDLLNQRSKIKGSKNLHCPLVTVAGRRWIIEQYFQERRHRSLSRGTSLIFWCSRNSSSAIRPLEAITLHCRLMYLAGWSSAAGTQHLAYTQSHLKANLGLFLTVTILKHHLPLEGHLANAVHTNTHPYPAPNIELAGLWITIQYSGRESVHENCFTYISPAVSVH